MHRFEFRLTSLPHCFDAIGTDSRRWINEVAAVVDGTVLIAEAELDDVVVCGPHVRPNLRAWQYPLLYEW